MHHDSNAWKSAHFLGTTALFIPTWSHFSPCATRTRWMWRWDHRSRLGCHKGIYCETDASVEEAVWQSSSTAAAATYLSPHGLGCLVHYLPASPACLPAFCGVFWGVPSSKTKGCFDKFDQLLLFVPPKPFTLGSWVFTEPRSPMSVFLPSPCV